MCPQLLDNKKLGVFKLKQFMMIKQYAISMLNLLRILSLKIK